MKNVAPLTQRELAASFYSPVAYIVALAFMVAAGHLFLTRTLVAGNEATLRGMLDGVATLLVFTIPLLTMRALAEEFSSGTIETLMTAPVTDVEVVLSKFLGVMLFYLVLLATTAVHAVVLRSHAGAEVGVILYGYVGLILLGALYVAVGLFASSLTRYQLVAAVVGIGILCVFTLVVDAVAGWKNEWRGVLDYVNVLHQFEDFSKGIFDLRRILFFITSTLFFLFLSVKVLESRRWR